MKIRNVFVSIAMVSGLAVAGAAIAQQEDVTAEQQAPAPAVEVSDQQLQQFADAQGAIAGIQEDFSGRLEGVEDPEEAQALQLEANEAMIAAVEGAGLDVDQYNQVAMAIQNNPELQERLTELME